MDELAQSIKERGMIVPIKVRPNGKGYEVVYGHRRVEAARRAEKQEVPAIIEDVSGTESLIQALIENVQREDMEPNDVSDSMQLLIGLGFSRRDIAAITGLHHTRVDQLVALQEESPEVRAMITKQEGKPKSEDADTVYTVGEGHVRQVRRAGVAPKSRIEILKKAAKENLTIPETRDVSDAYVAADSPELKAKVLETSGKLGSAEAILDSARWKLARRTIGNERERVERQAVQEWDSAVKDFMDAMSMFNRMIKATIKAAGYGKFSPEARPFAIRRIDSLIEELEALKKELGDE